ncbi:hemoglobin/transferrin/lactoferrin receptor protein [Marivirga sericea]|uniref:Hemoglobin/transferrin/lactoferrin receptor protein n=1 Tax=Marivirga sericea TaxID=1028 RepID=A0A1X7J8X0_9BACT|nr:TonB-dependent receptor [Marivirga sericea]SMG24200.1 hemoglobin/transferrin/lactoferrin receptor protein [Marivirga sericea]
MRNILLLCLFLGSSTIAYSQTITIKDANTSEPIEMVTIVSEETNEFISTDKEGKADISTFSGAQKIQIQRLGYQLKVLSYEEIKVSDFIIKLKANNFNLNEVIVSATRWRQNTGDIPSKVTTISPEEVELQNPQTAADLLAVSGKVYIQKSQQGGGSPMIRGFATNRLLYTVDGVRMNNAIFRGGNIQNVISLDPFATENTEVVFGPGSVIYGSDAVGGVMSFQTLSPKFSDSGEVLISGKMNTRFSSANNEKTLHADVKYGWKKWAFVTSASRWDYDHLRQGRNGPDDYLKTYHVERIEGEDRLVEQEDPLIQNPTAYTQKNFMQRARFQPNESWDFQYGFHYSETSDYGRYDRLNRVMNGEPRYAEWKYGPQKWMMNNLNITHSKETKTFDQLSIRLAQQQFEESRIDRNFQSEIRRIRAEKVDAYSANIDFIKKLGEKSTVFYGAEYILNNVESNGKQENILIGDFASSPSRYPQSNWSSMAVYTNYEFKPSDDFTLQGGIRYNHFLLDAEFDTTFYSFPFTKANINNGALTGSLGMVYHPGDSWSVNANFATAFRAPNVDDVGKIFDSEPGAVVIPNPNLTAEYAYNWDVGIAKVFNDFLKVDFTAYYTILNNAMVRRNSQLNGQDSIIFDGERSQVQSIQNAAIANVYGLQAGMEMKFPGGINLSSDLNYQIGEEELDDGSVSPSRHAPPLFGTTRLNFKSGDWNVQLYANYQAERPHSEMAVEERRKTEIYALDENGNTYAPAWYTLNFKMSYQLLEDFGLNVGVENLTDQRYRPYSSGMSAPGRNFILSLNFKF